MKKFILAAAIAALASPAMANPSSTTLVQQLQSYFNYESDEADEYGGAPPACGSNCYHYYRSVRLGKQIVTALALEAAGTPGIPIQNAWGVAPIWDADGFAIPGTGATAPNAGNPTGTGNAANGNNPSRR